MFLPFPLPTPSLSLPLPSLPLLLFLDFVFGELRAFFAGWEAEDGVVVDLYCCIHGWGCSKRGFLGFCYQWILILGEGWFFFFPDRLELGF